MKTYLFNGPHLFKNGSSFMDKNEEPEPMTLRCINVKCVGNDNFMGSDTWNFQIEGRGDEWYHTNYRWALVEETAANKSRMAAVMQIREEIRALELKARQIQNCVTDIGYRDD